MEKKLFLALGIITIISGIVLIAQRQYIFGISGALVGVWLTWDNLQKVKNNNNQ